jgi:mannosyltransferase
VLRPRLPLLGLALLVAAAAGLRFWGIGSRALWLDESYSAWFAALDWRELWLETPQHEVHPPFFYSVLKLWTGIAGDGPAALRMPSALAGTAAIPVMALVGRELAGLAGFRPLWLPAAIAGALAAFSSALLLPAQDARAYSFLFLAFAIALLSWLRLGRDFRARPGAPGRGTNWLLLGAATALTLWLHAIGLLYAGALLVALLLLATDNSSPARWRRLGATVTVTVLVYLPCLAMLAGRVPDWRSGWAGWNPGVFPRMFFQIYGVARIEESYTPVAAASLILLLSGVGLWALIRSGLTRFAAGFLLLMFLPPLAAALISALGTPVFLPRTLIGLVAPAYVIAAFGLARLDRRAFAAAAAALAIVFVTNLGEALVRGAYEPWNEVAETIRARMRPGDEIWTYPNHFQLPLRAALGPGANIVAVPAPYPALDAEGIRKTGSPGVVTLTPEAAARWRAAHRLPDEATIWLVRRGHRIHDPTGAIERIFARGRRAETVREWRDLDVVALRPLR